MTTEPSDAGSGSLSIEDAVGLLSGAQAEQEEQAQEAPVEAAEGDEDTSGETNPSDDTGEPDEAGDGGDAEAEAEAAAEPVKPPQWWSNEAKAKFAELPPELQAEVIAQEGKREEVTAKVKAEARQQSEAAEQRIKEVQQIAEGLNNFLPQALQAFKSKWDDVDWAAWAEQDPEACFKGKLQFEQEQQHLNAVATAQAQAAQIQHQEYVKAEFAKLREVAPDLAGEDEPAKQRRSDVGRFLQSQGVSPEALGAISAVELAIAYDAMRYRQAKAEVAAKPKAPAPKPAAPVKAAAAPPVRSSQQRSVEQLRGRLARSNDPVADAVALLRAQRARP